MGAAWPRCDHISTVWTDTVNGVWRARRIRRRLVCAFFEVVLVCGWCVWGGHSVG